jgi:hypothetical protein
MEGNFLTATLRYSLRRVQQENLYPKIDRLKNLPTRHAVDLIALAMESNRVRRLNTYNVSVTRGAWDVNAETSDFCHMLAHRISAALCNVQIEDIFILFAA